MTNPLFKRDGATGKVHYYYNSHLGQPLKLFDKAGKITWAARSQAFGQTTVFVNETENNLRFPGQYEDGETGLFYNYHRYYDQLVARYLQKDPLGLEADINIYRYGFSNSTSFSDPTGEAVPAAVLVAAVGGVIGAISGAVGAMSNPCADGWDILRATAVGGAIGAISGVIPIIRAARGLAAARGFMAGFGGNTAGQLLSNHPGQPFNLGQAFVQGAIGGLSMGAGNALAFRTALDVFKSGGGLSRALTTGDRTGSLAAMGIGLLMNLANPMSMGGLLLELSEPAEACLDNALSKLNSVSGGSSSSCGCD